MHAHGSGARGVRCSMEG
ncbi:hypothetical protein DEJ30_01815 [Curtobacterium sp. MCPF17_003]|nr:hypothetical protein DEJ30_01815 [Curtobacterium sp. MCPF17_003]PZF33097.1 hypothetical protein DEJ35_03580 [Curtobacterium sp. MCPF17_051]